MFKRTFGILCFLLLLNGLKYESDLTASDHINGKPILIGTWMGLTSEYLAGEIQLKVKPEFDSDELDSLLQAHECFLIHDFNDSRWGLVGCDTTDDIFEKIDSLSGNPLVEWAEPNPIIYPLLSPNDTYFDSMQWHLNNTGDTVWFVDNWWLAAVPDADIDAIEAWDLETGSSDVLIGILDSGIALDSIDCDSLVHPDLSNSDKYLLGWNFIDSSDCVRDESGHGTFVTGILAAMTNNEEGIAGVCWGCRVLINRIQNFVGGTAWNCAKGIEHAIENGAKILNISAGEANSSWNSIHLENAVAAAEDSNCLIVAAAGNTGNANILFPAAYASYGTDSNHLDGYRNVIAVGGTNWKDRWFPCSYSNDSMKITLSAPGAKILSTLPPYPISPSQDGSVIYGCLGHLCEGTSLSAPVVAGVAGLLQSHDSSLNPDSIRTILENTADDVLLPGWDDTTGYGRINALRALMALEGYYPNATGYVRVNTTWGDTLGDTLYVLGDVVIPQSCTLTIAPGAEVKLDTIAREDFGIDSAKCEIVVQGNLVIEGTPDSLVQLMSNNDSPSDSDWYGIRIDSTGNIQLENCIIQNAFMPIPWDSTHLYTMNHVTFRNCHTWPSVVDSGETLRVVDCVIQDFDTAITVRSWGTLVVDSCVFDSGEVAIFVDSAGIVHLNSCNIRTSDKGVFVKQGGSAKLRDCVIEDAYTGIYFNNSASDSVIGCTFRDNFMYGIKVQNNNLLIDSCTFVDSTGSDSGYYAIICYASGPTIKNTFIEGYKYGIKVGVSKQQILLSALIEECGFYNIGEVGIYISPRNDPTIKNCCFKGSYGKACIEVNDGNPYIQKCYMASDFHDILIGMLFRNGAGGTVRRVTVWDYDSCAVLIQDSSTNPNFGDADSIGCNWFEETNHCYFISNSDSMILAKSNYWDVDNGDTSSIRDKILGMVDIHPILGKCNHCFPYYSDQCSDLPPDDPTFTPCKIVATGEEEKDGKKEKGCLPKEFVLSQNYPNPFNPQTVIKYDLPEPAHVELTIYNVLGQKVRTLVDEPQEQGYKTLIWDGKDEKGKEAASGIYFFKLKTGDFEAVKRMILLR